MPTSSRRKALRHHDGAVGLRYVGQGAALPDVPARDLSAEEITELETRKVASAEFLIACGLYEPTDEAVESATQTDAESDSVSIP